MEQKSLKNIRKEFQENGIFYTPPELAKKLASYIDIKPESVYDPTCGAGALLRVFPDDVPKYGQELDGEQLALIDLPNFTGYSGDTLADDGFPEKKFGCIVANPPFSMKWNPDALKEDPRFTACPVMPPPSKADWAFMLHILYHLADDGVAASLQFPGILYRGQREQKIRRWFVEKNYIDRIVHIPGNTFEDTSIATCIVVLKKNRQTTDITFESGEREKQVPFDEIKANGFSLAVNTYLPDEIQKEEVDIDAVNREVVELTVRRVGLTFDALLAMQDAFPGDNLYITDLYSGLKDILRKHEKAVWAAELRREKSNGTTGH